MSLDIMHQILQTIGADVRSQLRSTGLNSRPSTPNSLAHARIRCVRQDCSYSTLFTGLKPSITGSRSAHEFGPGSRHARTERSHETVNVQPRRSSHEPANRI